MTQTMTPAEALAKIEALLASVEAGWTPAARKIAGARKALDALKAAQGGR